MSSVCWSWVTEEICRSNDNPSSVLSTLRSVAMKLLSDDVRYRTLDITNPKVKQRLLSYAHVMDFLHLLGFELNKTQNKLICNIPPSVATIRAAIDTLNQYQNCFRTKLHSNEHIEDTLTLEQIILWSTYDNTNNDTIEALILTHKTFTDSISLMCALKQRFFVSPPSEMDINALNEWENNVMKRIQLKTMKTLKDWIKYYWFEDFKSNDELQKELMLWLQQIEQTQNAPKWYIPLAKYTRKTIEQQQNSKETGCYLDDIEVINTRYLIAGYFRSISQYFAVNDPYYDAPHYVLHCCLQYFEGSLAVLHPKEFAEQLTIIDFERFRSIKAREFVCYAYGRNDEAKRITRIMKGYDALIEYVINSIMNVNKSFVNEIKDAIVQIIEIGEYLLKFQNYHSASAIFNALDSLQIQMLDDEMWKAVDRKYLHQFDEMKTLFSGSYSCQNIRQTIQKTQAPLVPYMKLYLRQLKYADESNNKRMIGFNKCSRLYDKIKVLQTYQEDCSYFTLARNIRIQKLLLQILL